MNTLLRFISLIEPALIFILALYLRLYQLGRNSFWIDEVHVANVVVQPSLIQAYNVMKNHVMPMPGDYIIAWILGHISLREGFLRLPSVLWGVLTIIILFLMGNELKNRKLGMLSALLLAVTPLHVHYSQELRFYSSLIFFYLTVTYLGYRACKYNSLKNWIVLTIVGLTGVFFHPFVFLAFLNVGFFILQFRTSLRQRITRLSIVLMIIGLFFAPYYLLVGFSQKYNEPLLKYSESMVMEILLGVGLMPLPYNPTMDFQGYIFSLVLSVCFSLCILLSIKNKKLDTIYLLISYFLQIGMIVLLGIFFKHTIVYRYFIFALPLTVYFSAIGLMLFIDASYQSLNYFLNSGTIIKLRYEYFSTVIVTLAIIPSIFGLIDYYSWPKSNMREIAWEIRKTSSDGMRIFSTNYSSTFELRYYLQHVLGTSDQANAIQSVSLDELAVEGYSEPVFLILDSGVSDETLQLLNMRGFKNIDIRYRGYWLGHLLLFYPSY